jgi:hypothetical protein
MLRKYVQDPSNVLESEPLQIRHDVAYEEVPVQIVDRNENELRRRKIPMVKVMWSNHRTPVKSFWELEEEMRAKYPQLFE